MVQKEYQCLANGHVYLEYDDVEAGDDCPADHCESHITDPVVIRDDE